MQPPRSKYEVEFEEINRIGKGAFGSVYKCKHKLEGKLYAIKKVKLKNAKAEDWSRAQAEVIALANLQHKAIVRYHTSWFQSGLISEFARSDSVVSSTYDTEDSAFTTGDGESTEPGKNDEVNSQEYKSNKTEDNSVTGETGELAGHDNKAEVPLSRTGMLYIQMELCGTTLRDWISARNCSCENEEEFLICLKNDECLMIFKRILQAVECMHDQSRIHRDLKPQNVFMLENKHVKVGDFGLATVDIFSDNPPSPAKTGMVLDGQKRHTAGVGTPTYASPEQLRDSKYTSKSDIYSLGVILFELYQKFDTAMERCQTLGNLREGSIPETMCECWPVQTKYIRKMTSSDPETRPSVKDILAERELFLSKDQVIAELKQKEENYETLIKQHEKSLKKLGKRLNQKKKAVDTMREKSGEYAIENLQLKRMVKLKEDELLQVSFDKTESELIKRMETKEAKYIAEINKLKHSLSKKSVALKEKDAVLMQKDKVISNLMKEVFHTED